MSSSSDDNYRVIIITSKGHLSSKACENKGMNSSDGRVVWSVCLLSCRLGFDSESGQTNDFKIGIHSFPAWRLALKGQCGEQAGKFTCCAVGKGT